MDTPNKVYTGNDVSMITVDPNRQDLRQAALLLVTGLVGIHGIADAIGIMVLGTEDILTTMMHIDSPFPEANIETIRTLLTALLGRVMSHADCCSPDRGEIH